MSYILPNGFASVIDKINVDISKIVISAGLGPAALAIYAIGSQNIPFSEYYKNVSFKCYFSRNGSKVKRKFESRFDSMAKSKCIIFFFDGPDIRNY